MFNKIGFLEPLTLLINAINSAIPRLGQDRMHAPSQITRRMAAINSCLVLVWTQWHSVARQRTAIYSEALEASPNQDETAAHGKILVKPRRCAM